MSYATLAMALLLAAPGDQVQVKFLEQGVTQKMGGYSPIRAELKGTADGIKKSPEGLEAPKYGALQLDNRSWRVILDEPEGKPARLYVDSNGDGDFTNDPQAKWESRKDNQLTMYNGSATIELAEGQAGTINLYRFDPKDPRRPQLKDTILFYPDFGFEVTLQLDGQPFSSAFSGGFGSVKALWVDRDRNGKRSNKLETIVIGKPFNFTGTTYVLKVADGKPALEKSADPLPQAPLPPDLSLGKKALTFKATATDGAVIDFPKSYAGKIVMLDFWATWCGPCIAELPNVKAAYEKHHGDGFEILGISFDQQNMEEKLAKFTKDRGMPWPQIYEGKFWNTTLGEMHDVHSIPFVILVDGDTGEILGTNKELRGPTLTEFIEKALKNKKKSL